ncbi:GH39 family glycosyl hydrolase [Clostridium thermarum]|uniref:GH39 family glycosyl hydrolase n=1 Tax=Clostridium thermarum TaxID=1716543 RepID=UPI0013D6E176|nr:xylan 1,4-beta-xylosidase [Clostridium thermarum]
MAFIKVDKDSHGAVFPSNWNYCVGTGRLGLALQKEYLDALALVKKSIDFKYIRGHGLLCDDVGIYREDIVDGEVRPFYNFTYIDRIFDSFLELGLKPFVEVGFMPKKLASGPDTVFYWEGNITPPKDYDKWANLVKAVVKHFIDRYGLEEVLQWPFEIWNEPNLTSFWKDANKEEYFKLYKVTATAIKEVNNDLKVGGPAICGGADHWIKDFLEFCHRENVPVDFVSRHAYTTKEAQRTPHLVYQETNPITYMLDEFKTVRGMIKESPFPDLPFHITEYNSSYHPQNPVHDTPFNAAYLARILSEGSDYVDSFSYWTFSDVFEETDVPRSQFHGGFGLMALNNIPKPTFHMFSFFSAMGEERLYRDEHLLVTRRKDGSIALVAWNESMEKGEGFEREYELELPIDSKDVFIKQQLIDENNGNPWGTWKQMGRPRFPRKAEVETLRQAAQPKLITSRAASDDGYVKLKFTLTKNAVTLIELTGIVDETDTYLGLDDSRITSY